MIQASVIEKAVILVVENALGAPRVKCGDYKNLDRLALRGSSGYVSTFKNSNDVVKQMSGILVRPVEEVKKDIGPMKLFILKDKTEFNEFGESESINGLSNEEIVDKIANKMAHETTVLIAEIKTLEIADFIVGKLFDSIDEKQIAISVLAGYKEGAKVKEFPTPPVVTPSWKVVGPKVVDNLSVAKPMMFITASKELTRVDKVTSYDESDVEKNFCMGCLPICQYFREFSYYTGSSWKYGA